MIAPMSASPTTEPAAKAPSPAKRWLRRLKPVLIAAVLLAVGWRLWALWQEVQAQQATDTPLRFHPGWLAVSAVTFALGAGCYAMFWRTLLHGAGLPASWLPTLRAYYVGTVGKYIPGKAWVILLRVGLLPRLADQRFRTSLTVVYETSAQMAVGAGVAAICLGISQPGRWWWWVGAAGISVTLLTTLHPAVFGRLARMAAVPFRAAGRDSDLALRYHTLVRGGLLIVAGWLLAGLSLAAVLHSLGAAFRSPSDVLTVVGAASLATAAGFLVLFMPSGLAVREGIMIELLAPGFGVVPAAAAALIVRLVWTITEVLLAGGWYLAHRGEAEPIPTAETSAEPCKEERPT